MAAERLAGAQRRLEVDRGAGASRPSVVRASVSGTTSKASVCRSPSTTVRQHAVDRDRVADRGGERRLDDAAARPRTRRPVPTSRTIPVNTSSPSAEPQGKRLERLAHDPSRAPRARGARASPSSTSSSSSASAWSAERPVPARSRRSLASAAALSTCRASQRERSRRSGRSGLVDVGAEQHVWRRPAAPSGGASSTGAGERAEQPRPVAGDRRRDEEQQLVDEVRARGTRSRASGRPRAAATGRLPPPSRPSSSSSGPGAARARSRPGAGRGRTRAAAAGARRRRRARQPRVVRADRAHADGDRVGGGAQLVDEPAALLPGHPAARRARSRARRA